MIRSTIISFSIIVAHLFLFFSVFIFGKWIPERFRWLGKLIAILAFLLLPVANWIARHPSFLGEFGLDITANVSRAFWFTSTTSGFLLALLIGTVYKAEQANRIFLRNVLLFAYVTSLVFAFATYATFAENRLQLSSSVSGCLNRERVLWAGSEKIVTTCHSPPYDREKKYFILNVDGLSFETFNETGRPK